MFTFGKPKNFSGVNVASNPVFSGGSNIENPVFTFGRENFSQETAEEGMLAMTFAYSDDVSRIDSK